MTYEQSLFFPSDCGPTGMSRSSQDPVYEFARARPLGLFGLFFLLASLGFCGQLLLLRIAVALPPLSCVSCPAQSVCGTMLCLCDSEESEPIIPPVAAPKQKKKRKRSKQTVTLLDMPNTSDAE